MAYSTTASQIRSPARAGASITHPLPSPSMTPHSNFVTAMALMTTRPYVSDRFQNARHITPSIRGGIIAETIFSVVHSPVSHSRSNARNPSILGSTRSGAGNQNLLVARATSVSTMPEMLRR
jgi:hypothetical protein